MFKITAKEKQFILRKRAKAKNEQSRTIEVVLNKDQRTIDFHLAPSFPPALLSQLGKSLKSRKWDVNNEGLTIYF